MSEIHKALFKLQGVIRGVKKDSQNPHFRNSYASLEAVTDTIRPHMQDLGLFWYQTPGKIIDGSIEVKTVIGHADSGETIEGTMEMPLAKRDPQGAGSALTYGCRYSLMAILGLPPTDDDAETAIDRNDNRAAPEPVKAAGPLSAHQLKKDKVWEKVTSELDKDFLDCATEAKWRALKLSYRETVAGWPQNWKAELEEKFSIKLEQIRQQRELDEATDGFPGDIRNHVLMAGE